MTIQRLWTFLPPLPGQRTASRSITSLTLLLLVVMGLPALSSAQVCPPDGDVDRNGSVTAADALLAFQQALGLAQLTACQRTIANVFPQPNAPDASITASDALCIFQKALSLPSCLDTLPSTNLPPVADAGFDQFVFGNEIVTLTGSGSDADGTIVRYRWVQTSGPPVVLSGADTPTASFTAPEVAFENLLEELEFQLTVTDDDGASDTAVVLVVVFFGSATNEPPTANAGFDQTVSEGTLVTLSGSATDSDGLIIAYTWLQTSGTPVELMGGDTPNPGFFAPEVDSDEELVFELAVFDDEFGFAADTVTITVLNAVSNTPPVADAGRDQTVDEDTSVMLSGSGSDSDGTIVGYRWTQMSGTSVMLTGANTRTASFTAPDVDSDEDLVFQLTVTDDRGASGTDSLRVTVRAAPAAAGLRAELFHNPAPGKPNYVMAGDNASLQYWTEPDGRVSQAVYESADGAHRVRVFYDEETELPQAVLDEVSGNWLSIREYGTNRIDFWAFDSDGNYQDGFAVYAEDGEYYMGETVGVPAHEGREITGDLLPSPSSWTGSFTLEGDVEDGLTNIQVLSDEQALFMEGLVPADVSRATAYSPVVAGLSDGRTLRKAMLYGGLGLLGIGVAPLLISGGALIAPAVLIGGTSVWLSEVLPPVVGGIRQQHGCAASDEGICSLVGAHLADPNVGIVATIRNVYDWATEAPERLRDRVNRGGQYLENAASRLSPGDLLNFIFPAAHADPPDSDDAPPFVSGNLLGQALGQGGASVSLTGTIGAGGGFTVTGTGNQGRRVSIRGSVSGTGTVDNGTFDWGSDSGTVPVEFPAGTPYVMCAAPLPTNTCFGGCITYEFVGWITSPDYPYVTYQQRRLATNQPTEIQTRHAFCRQCRSDGTFGTYEPSQPGELPCSGFHQYAQEAWDYTYQDPVVTRSFGCLPQWPNHFCADPY